MAKWTQLPLPNEYLPRSTLTATPPPPTLQARAEIVRLQGEGYGLAEIARSLNDRAVPTPSGRGRWWPDSVRRHVNPGPWADYIRRYRLRQR